MSGERHEISHSFPWITDGDRASVIQALTNGTIAHGDLNREFETRCLQTLGGEIAFSTPSGRDALVLALQSVGVSGNSEVILPSYVCDAVRSAVLAVGAIPVYSDIGSDWCLDVKSVERHINKKTSAIIVVHPFGISCNVTEFKHFSVPIIEDFCQNFGARSGLTGDVAVFSFHATKCLTTGEGGLVLAATEDAGLALTRLLRGGATRLSDLQAALGLSQLSRYPEMLTRRKDIACYYFEHLPDKLTNRLDLVKERSIFFRFLLQIEGRFEDVQAAFLRQGVHVRKGVDALLHREDGLKDARFSETVLAYDRTVSIPIYPALSDVDLQKVAAVTRDILG